MSEYTPTTTLPQDVVDGLREVCARYDDGDGEAERLLAVARRALARRIARAGRTCSACGERKPLAAFSVDAREGDGLRRYCRACAAADKAKRA